MNKEIKLSFRQFKKVKKKKRGRIEVPCSYEVGAMGKLTLHRSERVSTTTFVVLIIGNSRVESLRRTEHL